METLLLIIFTLVFVIDAAVEIMETVKSIKEDKKELQRMVRERLQREENFNDCVDYGKV
jgi:hypothetical protein